MALGPYLGRHLAAFNWGHTEGHLAGYWWLGLLPLAFLVLLLVFQLLIPLLWNLIEHLMPHPLLHHQDQHSSKVVLVTLVLGHGIRLLLLILRRL